MIRLVVLINIIYFSVACQLIDDTVSGNYGSVPETTPVAEPIGLKLNLNNCSGAPPEALAYSCSLLPEAIYVQNIEAGISNKMSSNLSLSSTVSFQLTQNSCTGLSLSSVGRLEGTIAKTVTETCSLSIQGSMKGFTVQETLNLVVAPSLTFSFDKENLFLQEGQGYAPVDLVLSEPAPYDTFVEFEIYGDSAEVLSGISFITKRLNILKGQSRVTLELFVDSGISQVVHQQLRIKSGSVHPLPAVSINAYENTIAPRSFEKIYAGANHTCGIDDGKLFCWGTDSVGQLGNGSGSSDNVSKPTQIGTSNLWQSLALGSVHTCGIDDGKLFCWGWDLNGQVGNGSSSNANVKAPLQIGSSNQWQSIAAEHIHTCGIDNGMLFCWGTGYDGQLGNGSNSGTAVVAPQQIGSSITWQSVTAGLNHTCGINNGMLFCWGRDLSGQVGNGSGSNSDVLAPQQIGSSNLWQSLSLGESHSCGIDNGMLFCWGKDSNGQLGNGNGSGVDILEPEQIGASNLWQKLALGSHHTCGVDDGKLYCWGQDQYGQLGNGSATTNDVLEPQQIGESSLWKHLGLGQQHTCGIDSDKLYCWGTDVSGQLGNGNASGVTVLVPKQTEASGQWQSISLGNTHSCYIDDGELSCWGRDQNGQLGNGSENSANVLSPQNIGPFVLWESVAAGGNHTCGINNGKLFCWGRDSLGQIGNGSGSNMNILEPEQIGSSALWQSLALGEDHTCGINDGKLFCWGEDSDGQIGNGNGSSADVLEPEQIGSSNLWQTLSLGTSHTCGIDDGKLFCWGSDTNGQIGNGSGSSLDVLEPEQIGSSTLWQHLALGYSHTCGIDDGKIYCWGSDFYGAVGNGSGSSGDISAPQQIGIASSWQNISAGFSHTCAIADGKLYCWGANYFGQIGNGIGSIADVLEPQQIGSSTLWQSIALGSSHTCGVDDGKLLCWGTDGQGQLGQSTSFLGSPFLVIE